MIGVLHIVGIIFVLVLIACVGAYSGRKVCDAADFTTGGGKAGTMVVAGTIMGTLVSGQATVGTAQLAFNFGMSAWWFTLGSGIGCLILAIAYAKRMRHSGKTTLVGVITRDYGEACDYAASVFSSIGIFISVIAQMISATALITTIIPMPLPAAALVSVLIMTVYVVFGGVWGAGIGGVMKLILLYVSSIAGGVFVLKVTGCAEGINDMLTGIFAGSQLGEINDIYSASDIAPRFASLVARGPLKDLGSGLSLVLGVISTQSYASAIWAAKSDSAAVKGSLISALLIPPIGVACILIGLFMRGHCITSEEAAALIQAGQSVPEGMMVIASSAQVFPQFVLHYLHPLFGGIVLGTLFITIVGGGAGLSLGVSTIVVEDIIAEMTMRFHNPAKKLFLSRGIIVFVLVLSAVIALLLPSAMINDFGFLSMGLRGAVIFVPLTTALYLKGRISANWGLTSVIAGPASVIAGNILKAPFDPLFIGVAVNIITMTLGLVLSGKNVSNTEKML